MQEERVSYPSTQRYRNAAHGSMNFSRSARRGDLAESDLSRQDQPFFSRAVSLAASRCAAIWMAVI
jgi:hypothetical protein